MIASLGLIGKVSCLYEDEPFERRLAPINQQAELGASLWDLTRAFDCPELFHFSRHPVILGSLESLLGAEIAWTGSYVTRPKLPRNEGTVFPRHQDSQYYGQVTQHLHVISLWILLVGVAEDNGCFYVILGSHTWNLLKGPRGANNKVHTLEEVEQRGQPLAWPSGEVSHFGDNVIVELMTWMDPTSRLSVARLLVSRNSFTGLMLRPNGCHNVHMTVTEVTIWLRYLHRNGVMAIRLDLAGN